MGKTLWAAVRPILEELLDLEESERATAVAQMKASGHPLAMEVERLLRREEGATSFLKPPIEELESPAVDTPNENSLHRSGDIIEDWRLVSPLGTGGMGEVWLVERKEGDFEQNAAMKVVRAGLATPQVLARFQQERRLLARLSHDGVAKLIDGGTTPTGQPYFLMEHVDGVPIDGWCDEQRLGVEARIRLVRRVCEAVSYAHGQLIVHRDIKPSNILITKAGTPKLLDFGIAKLLDEAEGDELTRTEQRRLTPRYAAPEQFNGEAITAATDVYLLGVLLFELLTGRGPHELTTGRYEEYARLVCLGESISASEAVLRARPLAGEQDSTPTERAALRNTTPDRLGRRLRGDLDVILAKALRPDPARRYASVEQFSEDLRLHLESLPVKARPESLWYRTRKFTKRHAFSLTAGLLVVSSLSGGLGTSMAMYRDSESARLNEAQARKEEKDARLEAERAQRSADLRFEKLRELSDEMLFEVHRRIQHLNGSLEARRYIVTSVKPYLDWLRGEVGDEPSLLEALALAYSRLGTIQSLEGDSPKESWDHSRALYDRLNELQPLDFELRQKRAHAMTLQGEELQQHGRLEDSLEPFTRAGEEFRALLEIKENDQTARRRFVLNAKTRANVLTKLGRYEEATRGFEEVMVISRKLLGEDPEDGTLRADFTEPAIFYAEALRKSGKFEAAWDTAQEAVDLLRTWHDEEPNNRYYTGILFNALYMMSIVAKDLDEPEEARSVLEEALAIAVQRVEANPGDIEAMVHMGQVMLSSADMELQQFLANGDEEHLVASEDSVRESLWVLEDVLGSSPDLMMVRLFRCEGYSSLARILLEAGRLDESAEALSESQREYDSLRAAQYNHASLHGQVIVLDLGRARLAIARGEPETARSILEATIAHGEKNPFVTDAPEALNVLEKARKVLAILEGS